MNHLENDERTLVSLIVPALNEFESIPDLLERVRLLRTENPSYEFELILIDDGSHDATAERAILEADHDSAVTVVQLSRTFGSHYAISAGFEYCSGACAIVLGADLQEPASLVGEFLSEWAAGAEVVWGVRRSRVGRTWRSEAVSRLFSHLFTRYARLENYPPEGPSGVLLDRCVIDEVIRLPERNRNVMALIAWLGYRQSKINYDQQPRTHGASRWTRTKMIKLAVDSLIQFSSMPLRACSISGVLVAAAGALYAMILITRGLLGVDTPSGWPTILVVVLVLGGMQLAVIGIMGEYLWRAVEEVRKRPLYVVREVRKTAQAKTRETRIK